MKKLIALFLLISSQANAWEFSGTPLCTVLHEGADMTLEMTYDPGLGEYTLNLTRTYSDWPAGPVFALRFDGPAGLTISTGSHSITGNQLTVKDSGFGNVLNGLQYNIRAVALIAGSETAISLQGAAPAVAAFRECDTPFV